MNTQIPLAAADTFFRLHFDKRTDRWGHRWQVVNATGDATDVLISIEGTPDDAFPASTPLQEINQHELPNGDAILGVGQAGRGHWSASYSIETVDGQPSIKCDLACLLKQVDGGTKPWLGSTYAVLPGTGIESIKNGVLINAGGAVVKLSVKADEASVDISDGQIKIAPAAHSQSKTVATRWLFEMASA